MIPGDDPTMHGAATRALRRLHPELADQGPIARAVARRGWCYVKTARGNEVAIPIAELDDAGPGFAEAVAADDELRPDPAPPAEPVELEQQEEPTPEASPRRRRKK